MRTAHREARERMLSGFMDSGCGRVGGHGSRLVRWRTKNM